MWPTKPDQNWLVCVIISNFLLEILFKENEVFSENGHRLSNHLTHFFFPHKVVVSISSFAKRECFASSTTCTLNGNIFFCFQWWIDVTSSNFSMVLHYPSYSFLLSYECSKINLLDSYSTKVWFLSTQHIFSISLKILSGVQNSFVKVSRYWKRNRLSASKLSVINLIRELVS